MRILAHCHLYVPEHGAGAEWTLHELLRHARREGHEVQVYATRAAKGYTFEDVPVLPTQPKPSAYEWADVAVTHLDETPRAVDAALLTRTPLVHLIHNDAQVKHWRLTPVDAALLVYNSYTTAASAPEWARERMLVIHPPVPPLRYQTPGEGQRITLLNLMMDKGAGTFWRLARQLPEYSFLGVRGAYGEQVVKPLGKPFPNVTLWPNQRDVRAVYRETRILLMPSRHESYGRCAVEAACSGIPSIVAQTPGLTEATMGLATYLPVGAPAMMWRDEVRRLMREPGVYQSARERARGIVARLDASGPERFLAALEHLPA